MAFGLTGHYVLVVVVVGVLGPVVVAEDVQLVRWAVPAAHLALVVT